MTAFQSADDSGLRWMWVCMDCADADELARFYAQLLGWQVTASDGVGWAQVRDPAGGVGITCHGETWYEPPVWPEQRGALTKMLHLDIRVDDLAAAIQHAVGAGARLEAHQPPGRAHEISVMLDPAGHPFCLYIDNE